MFNQEMVLANTVTSHLPRSLVAPPYSGACHHDRLISFEDIREITNPIFALSYLQQGQTLDLIDPWFRHWTL